MASTHPVLVALLAAKAGLLFAPENTLFFGSYAHAGRRVFLRKIKHELERMLTPAERTVVLKDIAQLQRTAKEGWASRKDFAALSRVVLSLSTTLAKRGAEAVEEFFDELARDLKPLFSGPPEPKKARG